MCESFCGCASRRNFPKIRFKFFKLVLNKINFFSRNEQECIKTRRRKQHHNSALAE